jgi:hypothetical protein
LVNNPALVRNYSQTTSDVLRQAMLAISVNSDEMREIYLRFYLKGARVPGETPDLILEIDISNCCPL